MSTSLSLTEGNRGVNHTVPNTAITRENDKFQPLDDALASSILKNYDCYKVIQNGLVA